MFAEYCHPAANTPGSIEAALRWTPRTPPRGDKMHEHPLKAEPFMSISRERLLSSLLVLSFGVGFDQTTKRIAELTLTGSAHSYLFDTFRLQFIKNSGAFLGFGSHFSPTIKLWLFLVFPVILLALALAFLLSSKLSQAQSLLVALIISGGIGNLIDRYLLHGLVTDFMNLGIGPLRTGIFNFADVAIMTGAFGLLFL